MILSRYQRKRWNRIKRKIANSLFLHIIYFIVLLPIAMIIKFRMMLLDLEAKEAQQSYWVDKKDTNCEEKF